MSNKSIKLSRQEVEERARRILSGLEERWDGDELVSKEEGAGKKVRAERKVVVAMKESNEMAAAAEEEAAATETGREVASKEEET